MKRLRAVKRRGGGGSRHRTIFALGGLLTLGACDDGPTGPAATACTDDTGTVTVTVSTAAAPVVSWDPACAVAVFLIEDGGSDMWGVVTDDTQWDSPATANLIAPPITYGVAPAAGDVLGPPETLVRGTTYEVVLWRVLPAGSAATCMQVFENVCLMAVHEFVH